MNFMNSFSNGQAALADFEKFFDELISKKSNMLQLELVVSEINGAPVFLVKHNQQVLFNDCLTEGTHLIKLEVPAHDHNTLTLSMQGKQSGDTEFRDGQIVKDKFIKINHLHIDNFDLIGDYDFFYSNFQYIIDNTKELTAPMPGFWSNANLILTYPAPFIKWYNSLTQKNINLAPSLVYQGNNSSAQAMDELIKSLKKLKY